MIDFLSCSLPHFIHTGARSLDGALQRTRALGHFSDSPRKPGECCLELHTIDISHLGYLLHMQLLILNPCEWDLVIVPRRKKNWISPGVVQFSRWSTCQIKAMWFYSLPDILPMHEKNSLHFISFLTPLLNTVLTDCHKKKKIILWMEIGPKPYIVLWANPQI